MRRCLTTLMAASRSLTSISTTLSMSSRSLSSNSNTFMNNNKNPLLISIEGNIGSGKTTILQHLKTHRPDLKFIQEPLDKWGANRDNNGKSLLELYYEDQSRWSYTFQQMSLLSRFNSIETAINTINPAHTNNSDECQTSNVFLTERCLETDHQVFAKMLYDDGLMNPIEYNLYLDLFNLLNASTTQISAIIYINTSPNICYDRIKSRSRDGEDTISHDYLLKIDEYQQKFV